MGEFEPKRKTKILTKEFIGKYAYVLVLAVLLLGGITYGYTFFIQNRKVASGSITTAALTINFSDRNISASNLSIPTTNQAGLSEFVKTLTITNNGTTDGKVKLTLDRTSGLNLTDMSYAIVVNGAIQTIDDVPSDGLILETAIMGNETINVEVRLWPKTSYSGSTTTFVGEITPEIRYLGTVASSLTNLTGKYVNFNCSTTCEVWQIVKVEDGRLVLTRQADYTNAASRTNSNKYDPTSFNPVITFNDDSLITSLSTDGLDVFLAKTVKISGGTGTLQDPYDLINNDFREKDKKVIAVITYKDDDNAIIGTQNVYYNETNYISKNIDDPSFPGWTDGTNTYDFGDIVSITSDIVLYPNKLFSTLTLNESSINLSYGTDGENSYTFDGDGMILCSSEDSTKVTCSVDTVNNKIIVHPENITSSAVTITVSGTGGNTYLAPVDATFTVNVSAREVTVTAPTVANSSNYSGSGQAIAITTGTCSPGGTMYYYSTDYTSSSAPAFSTSTWTTTYPSNATGTTVGTYYLWYYCYVSDTTNNVAAAGSSINTALSVTKEITKYTPTMVLGEQMVTVEINETGSTDVTMTTISACTGSLTVTSANTNYVTVSKTESGTYASTQSWSNVGNGDETDVYYKGVGVRDISTLVTVTYTPTDTTNCNTVTSQGHSVMIIKKTQNVTIDAVNRVFNGSKQYVCDEAITDGDGELSCVYYTDSTCTTKTPTSTGTNTVGGAPANAGTYYIKATASETNTYYEATSACGGPYKIEKYVATLDVSTENATVVLNSTGNFKATPTTISACVGELTAHTSNTSDVTLATSSSGTYGEYARWPTASNGLQKTIYYKGVRVRTDPTKIYVNYNPTDTNNCSADYREVVKIKVVNSLATACNAPTNVSVSTSGVVTWTKSSNCTSAQHQVKIGNGNFVNATSGVNMNSEITAATGTRYVYVKAVAPNSNYQDSANGSTSVVVYKITGSKGTGVSSISGAGNHISGATTTLTANMKSGFTFSKWSGCSTSSNTSISVSVNESKTCKAVGYCYGTTYSNYCYYGQYNTSNYYACTGPGYFWVNGKCWKYKTTF